jgi:NAD(P)-dependent dehydrogenase (short-subunit alcohol dehydrogenase family)
VTTMSLANPNSTRVGRLAGQTALITGGSNGIGAATARLFAGEGARVSIMDIDAENGEALVEELRAGGADAMFVLGDITIENEAEAAVKATVDDLVAIDILINNAGKAPPLRVTVDELTESVWDEILGELKGYFFCTKHAVMAMKKKGAGGSIVNVSSTGGLGGVPFRQAYCAAKAGMIGFTKSLALELAPDRIRVNCVAPGAIDTALLRRGDAQLSEERLSQIASTSPLGRVGQPEDVAEAIFYLASDTSSWISGIVIPLAGGASARS